MSQNTLLDHYLENFTNWRVTEKGKKWVYSNKETWKKEIDDLFKEQVYFDVWKTVQKGCLLQILLKTLCSKISHI